MLNDLTRLRSDDRAALADVFDRYRSRLRHMVDLRLDAPMDRRIDASDVVQETYLDAIDRLPEYLREPRVPIYVWLRGLAHGRLLKSLRHHLGAQCRALGRELPTHSASALGEALLATQTSPSQAAERRELQVEVRTALARLDDADREVILMRHFEGLGNREIALVLGISDSAATMRHGRALTRLQRGLRHGSTDASEAER